MDLEDPIDSKDGDPEGASGGGEFGSRWGIGNILLLTQTLGLCIWDLQGGIWYGQGPEFLFLALPMPEGM